VQGFLHASGTYPYSRSFVLLSNALLKIRRKVPQQRRDWVQVTRFLTETTRWGSNLSHSHYIAALYLCARKAENGVRGSGLRGEQEVSTAQIHARPDADCYAIRMARTALKSFGLAY
jgi:hypothetical protein